MHSSLLWLVLPGLMLSEARSLPRYATRVSRCNTNQTSYDFVIAGGGIAGLTLADRLTEDASVIEAGEFDRGHADLDVPGAWSPFPYIWGLDTQPLRALDNRTELVVCGKMVGGGSNVNAMNWIRGAAADFDGWVELGNPGWGWDDLLPYFIKSENFTAPNPEFAKAANISWDSSIRGHEGPVQYTYSNYAYPAGSNWWDATLSTGIKPAPDPMSGKNMGIFWVPNVRDAATNIRCGARTAHYDRVYQTRPNYHILTGMTVDKILFEGSHAAGVQYLPSEGGEVVVVRATKEVIVTAGALHSPGVLQRSGVGPRNILQPLGIDVVVDLPGVGTNFHDQTTVQVNFNRPQCSAYTVPHNLSTVFTGVSLRDLGTDSDPWEAIVAEAKTRDVAALLPPGVGGDATVLAGYQAQRELLLRSYAATEQGAAIALLYFDTYSSTQAYFMKPLSRGRVAIAGTAPLAAPLVDYGTAADPTDLRVNAALLRKMREVMAQPAMRALGPVELAPYAAGDGAPIADAAGVERALRGNLVISNAHQCCSNPMLPRARGGVVDPAKKVYGVSGLRVADVSTFPMSVSGGPTPTVYGTSEKLADMIKRDWCLDGWCS
ncbi:hypothetical protein PG994_012478 [Apiospora phragmitis]|uniref:Glucose-methanol-choline oxidoreductase N-terminal domain-containing protein n=1 Tax=Apiospora phragmitis TaxID=2905665 RepID=A0ABR1TYG5_9PEZI